MHFVADRTAGPLDFAAHELDVVRRADMEALEIDEQRVPRLVVSEPLTHAKPEQNLLESHRRTIEDTRIHRPRVVYDRLEIHLRKNVALDIDARRHFDQFHAALAALEDAALGHVDHGLTGLGSIVAGKGDVLHRLDEFTCAALAHDA